MVMLWGGLRRAVTWFNVVCGYASAVVIVASGVLLCYEVAMRYLLSRPTTWVLEASVFMLVAATFMGAGYTQIKQGHISITVLDALLPARFKAWRDLVNDTITLAFCTTVAAVCWVHWKVTWTEGWTAPTLWAPKLWIPYLFIAVGMTGLCLQQLIQLVDERIAAVRTET
jgi:TRAP-type C4-dicarboxylate transport system permease small subunit